MNTAEWILVAFLSCALLVLLILSIILVAKLIGITKEARKIILTGQDIADNANGIVANVKGMTSIGGVVQTFTDKFIDPKFKKVTNKDTKDEDQSEPKAKKSTK